MDNVRYQVFVSSTYLDLVDERMKVTQTLMEMDCIPAGMELFPAVDEEQWNFIKKVIDDCDYYLLIVGGRYGSLSPEGISYTEKEYDYALEIGLKIIVLIHSKPYELPEHKVDNEEESKKKLESFKSKISSGRLVKFWEKSGEIPGIVALSLQKTIKSYPAKGWVRSTGSTMQGLLEEINELRKINSELESKILDFKSNEADVYEIPNIAGLDEEFTVHGTHWMTSRGDCAWELSITWGTIFGLIAPDLALNPSQGLVEIQLKKHLFKIYKGIGLSVEIDPQDFQTITIQFKALGLITTTYSKTTKGEMAWFWNLTSKGERIMVELRTIKSKKNP